MARIKKFVTTVLSVLFAAALLSPAHSDAAKRTDAKRKPAAASHAVKSHAAGSARQTRAARGAKPSRVVVLRDRYAIRRVAAVMRVEPARPSFGQRYGLHNVADALELKSSVALVLDSETNEVLISKNPNAVLPIASLTKLMTAVVVTESNLPLGEVITVSAEDIDTEKGSRSRLAIGTSLTREELLHLALMASENRAASALGRAYPGGTQAFVAAMNRKARQLGMNDTHYVEPTGLSSQNQSSARDLVTLIKVAQQHQMIRDFSVSPEYEVAVGNRPTHFRTTNSLVRNPSWDIALQKTGYITEAGRCLVMQAQMAGRKLIMVFLDSAGKYSRLGDAERVRRWVTDMPVARSSLPLALPLALPLPLPLPLPAAVVAMPKTAS